MAKQKLTPEKQDARLDNAMSNTESAAEGLELLLQQQYDFCFQDKGQRLAEDMLDPHSDSAEGW